EIAAVSSADEALAALGERAFGCAVVSAKLPGIGGLDLVERIRERDDLRALPIAVYSDKPPSKREEARARPLAAAAALKFAWTPERLLDETALFLHRVEAEMPAPKRNMLRKLRQCDPSLENRKVLIVDDDIRNIFATTSILERHKIRVLHAENGKDGIALLDRTPDVDLVLMDIMRPGMDGYEAMGSIRRKR